MRGRESVVVAGGKSMNFFVIDKLLRHRRVAALAGSITLLNG